MVNIQGSAKRWSPELVNFVIALAYHFCLASPAAFTQPEDHVLAEPSISVSNATIIPQALKATLLQIAPNIDFVILHSALSKSQTKRAQRRRKDERRRRRGKKSLTRENTASVRRRQLHARLRERLLRCSNWLCPDSPMSMSS